MKDVELPEESSRPAGDRVVLGDTEARILSGLVAQFNDATKGLIKISKADLVNHLISSTSLELDNLALRSIAVKFYDESKWLTWAVQQLKDAKKNAVSTTFEDLVKFRDGLLSATKSKVKRPPKAKVKEDTSSEVR